MKVVAHRCQHMSNFWNNFNQWFGNYECYVIFNVFKHINKKRKSPSLFSSAPNVPVK